MSNKNYSPNWDKSLIKNVEKSYNNLVRGFDLTNYDDSLFQKVMNYLDQLLSNKIKRFDTSLISSLIKKDIVLTENQLLKIGNDLFRIGSFKKEELKFLVKENKNFKLFQTPDPENDLIAYLNSLSISHYEREFIFLITHRFDQLIVKYRLEKQIDTSFINQIYSVSDSPFDLIKFVFFTMAQHQEFKKDPLFKVIYNYLSNNNLDELFFYLKQN